jgi:hypothetical protein
MIADPPAPARRRLDHAHHAHPHCQAEALKQYRSVGRTNEQTINVQHGTVNDGGQAIGGKGEPGGGDTAKN